MNQDEENERPDWASMDGATAWHMIYRHADGWAETGRMMDEYVQAKIAHTETQAKKDTE